MTKTVNVRIRYGGQIMAYDCGDLSPAVGDWVICDGESPYLGLVVGAPVNWGGRDGSAGHQGGSAAEDGAGPAPRRPKLPRGRRILRLADEADLASQAENQVREREALEYCLSRIAVQKLEMKLVAVEIVLDNSKTIFYYTAEERVDFRLLVKELVSRFRTRIEMRQIGVRHEAKMVGGLGGCGRNFCCTGFLANFAPVSVKMAKEQNISLSPTKISGVCGRLMCCLAFEHPGYARGKGADGRDPSAGAPDEGPPGDVAADRQPAEEAEKEASSAAPAQDHETHGHKTGLPAGGQPSGAAHEGP